MGAACQNAEGCELRADSKLNVEIVTRIKDKKQNLSLPKHSG
jgi:hypothetical protein